MTKKKPERPDHKNAHLTMRIPQEWVDAATQRTEEEAQKSKKTKRTLLDIIRAYIYGYSIGEYPEPGPYPGEGLRAPKRKKKEPPPST